MGSLDENGAPISQARESLRYIGKAYTRSADRVESATVVDQTVPAIPGSGDAGLAALRLNAGVKLTRATNDSKVAFLATSGLLD